MRVEACVGVWITPLHKLQGKKKFTQAAFDFKSKPQPDGCEEDELLS